MNTNYILLVLIVTNNVMLCNMLMVGCGSSVWGVVAQCVVQWLCGAW